MSVIYGEKKRNLKKKLGYLIIGLAIITSAYYATKPDPAEVVATESEKILGALELLGIEYEEAVENGKTVKETEYEGAKKIMNRITELFTQMKPYATQLNPKLTEDIEKDLNRLKSMINEKSSPKDVNQLIEQTSKNIKNLKSNTPGQ